MTVEDFLEMLDGKKVHEEAGKVLDEDTFTLHGHPIKVGDKVFSLLRGWGEVVNLSPVSAYPIGIKAESGRFTFTAKGFHVNDHEFSTLAWTECYDVREVANTKPPKKLVKKWRWVCSTPTQGLYICAYPITEEEIQGIEKRSPMGFIVIQKIDSTMIEVEE